MPILDPDLLARIATLEARLGCRLGEAERVIEALTHKSFANEVREPGPPCNERLEFLGDAVIDLAVSHRLMELCPEADEGGLSRLRAGLVNEENLARVARSIGLGELLLLGRGEERTSGRDKPSVLADAFEAVLGAAYLAGGMARMLEVVDRHFGPALQLAQQGLLERDFKTDLQEAAQNLFKTAPRYRVIAEDGPDHAKVFSVEVNIGGEAYGRGSGRSKKDAEQVAARAALDRLNQDQGSSAAPKGLPG